MARAYYDAPIASFLNETSHSILGKLSEHHGFDLEEQQREAWKAQINLLKQVLVGISGHGFFEFTIPRMGKRVDVILLINGIIFVLEFKIGEKKYPSGALEQVMDYALDLKNFHKTSHALPVVPILVATEAVSLPCSLDVYPDGVYKPLKANKSTLQNCLLICLQGISHSSVDASEWQAGQYKPTPTIIEAAQALYRGHNVQEISRSDAGAINLSETSDAIISIIEKTKRNKQKAICFITGVPGAGKTLAGLNIANRSIQVGREEHAVFLSGNGPLVTVLREALVQDDIAKGRKREEATRKANTFIQNIHHFRDEYFDNQDIPPERVVIFDEAQRAWTKEMVARFMKRKRGLSDFDMSEPEFLISVLDRNTDWAVIICLIGGGQEINTGEAGLAEWFQALKNRFHQWQVYVSRQITDAEYLMRENPSDLLSSSQVNLEDRLHLAVSVRSYRSEKVSFLIKAILDCDLLTAQTTYTKIAQNYPIYLTRDIQQARNWLHQRARGSERFGLLASSGGIRLRPEGVFVSANIEVEHWFLKDCHDIRSSYALEGVATEFDIQGLELDWTAVAWDADLRFVDSYWEFKAFKGTKWQSVKDNHRRNYLKNSYRVLLTRARQGMILFVPHGDQADETRLPSFYDGTFDFLRCIGFSVI
jgi:hypothetical protein